MGRLGSQGSQDGGIHLQAAVGELLSLHLATAACVQPKADLDRLDQGLVEAADLDRDCPSDVAADLIVLADLNIGNSDDLPGVRLLDQVIMVW